MTAAISNARVLTMDPAKPRAEALGFAAGRMWPWERRRRSRRRFPARK